MAFQTQHENRSWDCHEEAQKRESLFEKGARLVEDDTAARQDFQTASEVTNNNHPAGEKFGASVKESFLVLCLLCLFVADPITASRFKSGVTSPGVRGILTPA